MIGVIVIMFEKTLRVKNLYFSPDNERKIQISWHICPKCELILDNVFSDITYQAKFCPDCGQALDCGDEDE